MRANAIGLLGGTFDPIHSGHLSVAQHVCDTLQLAHVEFIPCFQPPHRAEPDASPEHRLAMTTLAVQAFPKLVVNPIEIERRKISYTIDTLLALRQKNSTQPFCFIIGEDAFAHFDEWQDYDKILSLTHLVVVTRQHQEKTYSPSMQHLIATHETKDISVLHNTIAQKIYFQDLPPIPVAATTIRNALKSHQIPTELPATVLAYIQANNLYQ